MLPFDVRLFGIATELQTVDDRLTSVSRLPSFSDCTKYLCEGRLSGQHEAELFDEWPQSDRRHIGDEFVEHAALMEH